MRAPIIGRIVLLASVVLLAVSGCTKEVTQPSRLPDESSSSVSESTAPSADEQAIIAAYKGYFETLLKLGAADDEQIRQMLSPYAEGVAVENIVTGFSYFRANNQKPAGSVVFGPLAVAISGDSARVEECRDGKTELIVDATTGAVVSVGPVQGLRAEMVKAQDGVWLVASYNSVDGLC